MTGIELNATRPFIGCFSANLSRHRIPPPIAAEPASQVIDLPTHRRRRGYPSAPPARFSTTRDKWGLKARVINVTATVVRV
jgi:hypothetical protein